MTENTKKHDSCKHGRYIDSHPSISKEHPTATGVICIFLCIFLIVTGIHIQIPNQEYCSEINNNKHNGFGGPVLYQESLHKYDFSFGESKCIQEDEKLLVNPNYSIWGIRI